MKDPGDLKQGHPTRRRLLQQIGSAITIASLPSTVRGQTSERRKGSSTESRNALHRKIPSTGERIPAIGLGTFLTFDLLPGAPRQPLRQVMQNYWAGGARLIDTSPLYGSAEISVGDFATALGFTDDMFVANKI